MSERHDKGIKEQRKHHLQVSIILSCTAIAVFLPKGMDE